MRIFNIGIWTVLVFLFSFSLSENLFAQNMSTPRLVMEKYDSIILREYIYNDASQLIEQKIGHVAIIKYNYDDDNRLISIVNFHNPAGLRSTLVGGRQDQADWENPSIPKRGDTTLYSYNKSGQIVESTNYLGHQTYRYNDKNRIAQISGFIDGRLTNKIDYKYDGRGNLIKMTNHVVKEIGESERFTITTYRFDKKTNPLKSFQIRTDPGIFTNANNIIETKSSKMLGLKNHDLEVLNQSVYNKYEYNELGFPIGRDGVQYIYQ